MSGSGRNKGVQGKDHELPDVLEDALKHARECEVPAVVPATLDRYLNGSMRMHLCFRLRHRTGDRKVSDYCAVLERLSDSRLLEQHTVRPSQRCSGLIESAGSDDEFSVFVGVAELVDQSERVFFRVPHAGTGSRSIAIAAHARTAPMIASAIPAWSGSNGSELCTLPDKCRAAAIASVTATKSINPATPRDDGTVVRCSTRGGDAQDCDPGGLSK